jgi:hypothetical protein
MDSVRIYEIPDCKVVSSGIGLFGDENFNRFDAFLSSQPRGIFARDYLYWEGEYGKTGGFVWVYLYEEGMMVPEELSVVDFKGGLYAVATGVDGASNADEMAATDAFIAAHGFERDPSRHDLGNIITPPQVRAAMGYNQMDYFTAIKVKNA